MRFGSLTLLTTTNRAVEIRLFFYAKKKRKNIKKFEKHLTLYRTFCIIKARNKDNPMEVGRRRER